MSVIQKKQLSHIGCVTYYLNVPKVARQEKKLILTNTYIF